MSHQSLLLLAFVIAMMRFSVSDVKAVKIGLLSMYDEDTDCSLSAVPITMIPVQIDGKCGSQGSNSLMFSCATSKVSLFTNNDCSGSPIIKNKFPCLILNNWGVSCREFADDDVVTTVGGDSCDDDDEVKGVSITAAIALNECFKLDPGSTIATINGNKDSIIQKTFMSSTTCSGEPEEEISIPLGKCVPSPYSFRRMLLGTSNTFSGKRRMLQDTEVIKLTKLVSSSASPSVSSTRSPSVSPSIGSTRSPSASPSKSFTASPSESFTASPSANPSESSTASPSVSPSIEITLSPSVSPSESPTASPSKSPSVKPTISPSVSPSVSNTKSPTVNKIEATSQSPTASRSRAANPMPRNIVMNVGAFIITLFLVLA